MVKRCCIQKRLYMKDINLGFFLQVKFLDISTVTSILVGVNLHRNDPSGREIMIS